MSGAWAVTAVRRDDRLWPLALGVTGSEERRRGERVTEGSRCAWAAAHLLVRHVARELGASGADVLYDDSGRPRLAGGLHVSISHGRGAVAVAVGDEPCGMNVEGGRGTDRGVARALDAARDLLGAEPDEALRRWVALEADAKLTGTGLAPFLDGADHHRLFRPGPAARGVWVPSDRVLTTAPEGRWLRIDDHDDHVSAVSVTGDPAQWRGIRIPADRLASSEADDALGRTGKATV